jgi:predicted outer membrane repeat protein
MLLFRKNALIIFLILFVLAFIALGVTPAHAAGIRYAKPAASGNGDCLSWANACTLQTALTGATSGDEVWATAGAHKPTTDTNRSATFQLNSSVALYGGFAGTETSRSQRNPVTSLTILSGDIDNNDSQQPVITNLTTVTGNTTNSYHVVTGAVDATGATLDGFTITAGNADGIDPDIYCPDCGGGMFNDFSNLTLKDVTFSGNSASRSGGGLYSAYVNPILTNVTFNNNAASEAGGGMYNDLSSATLVNVIFNGNSAHDGGGIYNEYSSPTLANVTFSFNTATGGNGGGMYNDHNDPSLSDPSLTDVTFSDNTAAGGYGGGLYNVYSGPSLLDVTFSHNSASYGGGMYDNYSDSSLTNVSFYDNSALGGGGMQTISSTPILTHVTFDGNSAWFGGGIANTGSNLQIRNTIFWGNTALAIDPPGSAQIGNSNSIVHLDDSVVQDGCPPGSVCKHIITTDPLLGAPGNYGGFTQTIPLLPGSSAIDTGNNATCAATDQRGVSRPQGAYCDIGAFEVIVKHVYLPFMVR